MIVRQHLIKCSGKEVLNIVPLATTRTELDLSGVVKRQLSLGHSGVMCLRPDLGIVSFSGLHYISPDGIPARYYWNVKEHDSTVGDPRPLAPEGQPAKKKLDCALKITGKVPPKLRGIFGLTKPEQNPQYQHIWRDIELEGLSAGRVIFMGDPAHAMMPIRGEGGYHTLVDLLVLGKTLSQLADGAMCKNLESVTQIVSAYNDKMLQRGEQAVRDSRRLDLAAKRDDPDATN
ncbi:hypothetical protein N0V90_013509 [Kalmusia sp. IMI 367209]|nr:hypothetical protein N0V90_013509 [Kalmusia sp. IMI 367209]